MNEDIEQQMIDVIKASQDEATKRFDEFFKKQILENTDVKEPITYGKLKWRGIKMKQRTLTLGERKINTVGEWWLEQRGTKIGETYSVLFSAKINV